ncbi:lipoprotein insertase outer membrane protein LolB [Fulvimonas soli]|jgi:outer membrane lipoprotein LolB|uniref:Outer-membrane lipoprotein LolB n=1 Tax=Fulvimonas soli TaxID=155197 RepID=A0A316IK03_9GAMM|nr:lipoprotein insertase outer membrane protein LolB [Fulvimonas soli]PWK87542.1 outer membrane lipoprotein LolB [Fulvimonas soli]TNY26202.1 outer membrane lipoprotein LolB [Fulvimonas soli]
MKRILCCAAAALLLAGCAAPAVRMKGDAALLDAQRVREQALGGVDHWALEGRLAVSNGQDGGSGSLSWTQDGERYAFELRAPVTGKSFRLTGGPGGALLEGVEGGPLRGPDAESLMRRALGWDVPLRELRAWVLGLRADAGPAELSFGANRLPSLLEQDGWAVEYRAWDEARQPPLPSTVFASRPPYKVKLSIQSFRLDAGAPR